MQVKWLFAALFMGAAGFYGCRKSSPETGVLVLSRAHKVLFLDSLAAAAVIVTDTTNHFFEQITPLDMSIQLRSDYPAGTPHEIIRKDYRQLLQNDVTGFTAREKALLEEVLRAAFQLCLKYTPGVFSQNLQLVKTNGKAYGPGVFFTRENAIVLPAAELIPEKRNNLLRVLLHEIFHIYSRRNPEKRDRLYELIGYEKLLVDPGGFRMDSTLRAALLLNPDGMDIRYAIRLPLPAGDTVQAVPVFFAGEPRYNPLRQTFFDHTTFFLFAIEQDNPGQYTVQSLPGPRSTLETADWLPAYYDRITDNTDYIIHPEEILADNFALLLLLKTNIATPQPLSEKGKDLLRRLEEQLKED